MQASKVETGVREITLAQAVREALAEEMRRDSRVFIMGEDIAEAGHPSIAVDLRSHGGRQVMRRGSHRCRRCGCDLEGSHASLAAQAVRDGERECLVHRRRADRRARQPADP